MKQLFKFFFGQLQRIGKALMLPVAILPAAGILLAFGNAMHNEQILHYAPCLLYTSPSPRDLSTSRMPSSA